MRSTAAPDLEPTFKQSALNTKLASAEPVARWQRRAHELGVYGSFVLVEDKIAAQTDPQFNGILISVDSPSNPFLNLSTEEYESETSCRAGRLLSAGYLAA